MRNTLSLTKNSKMKGGYKESPGLPKTSKLCCGDDTKRTQLNRVPQCRISSRGTSASITKLSKFKSWVIQVQRRRMLEVQHIIWRLWCQPQTYQGCRRRRHVPRILGPGTWRWRISPTTLRHTLESIIWYDLVRCEGPRYPFTHGVWRMTHFII